MAARFRALLLAARERIARAEHMLPPTAAVSSSPSTGAVASAAAPPPALWVSIGNEAADADSCVGALSYAYLLEQRGAPGAVGVISCPRDAFFLRREAIYLLDKCLSASATSSTDTENTDSAASSDSSSSGSSAPPLSSVLLFEGDLDLTQLHRLAGVSALRISLVDHNKLTGRLAALSDSVHDITDHHRDSGAHPLVTGDRRCISFDESVGRGVGSTCTLIAESLLQLQQERAPNTVLDAAIAEMLLGVILLDTDGLSATSGKTTPTDVAVAARLRALLPPSFTDASALRLCSTLRDLRTDRDWWAALSPEQMLQCDYKTFEVAVPIAENTADAAGPSAAPTPTRVFGVASMALHVTRFLRCAPRPGVEIGSSEMPCEDARGAASASVEHATTAATATLYPARALRGHTATAAAPDAALSSAGDLPKPFDGGAAVNPRTLQRCLQFARGQGLDFLVLMSRRGRRKIAFLYVGERHRRHHSGASPVSPSSGNTDTAAFSLSEYATLISSMASNPALALQEQPTRLGPVDFRVPDEDVALWRTLRVFRQGNSKATRKQVVPLIEDFFVGRRR